MEYRPADERRVPLVSPRRVMAMRSGRMVRCFFFLPRLPADDRHDFAVGRSARYLSLRGGH
jgi:hypothetical protein